MGSELNPKETHSNSTHSEEKWYDDGILSIKKCFELCQIGDDVKDYFVKYKRTLPTFPFAYPEGPGPTDKLRASSVDALQEYCGLVGKYMEARTKCVLACSRVMMDDIFIDKLRVLSTPNSSNNVNSNTTNGEIVESNAQSGTDGLKKSRMDGVDVSALPAGFGKRKSATRTSVGDIAKRPKTPTQSVPLVDSVLVEEPSEAHLPNN